MKLSIRICLMKNSTTTSTVTRAGFATLCPTLPVLMPSPRKLHAKSAVPRPLELIHEIDRMHTDIESFARGDWMLS